MGNGYAISAWPDEKEVYAKMQALVGGGVFRIKQGALAKYLNYFETRCFGSKEMIEEAKKYIPGGVQHNLAFNYPFPLSVNKASGPYLYDVDGNRYVDYLQAGGPTLLGSNYLPVQEKVLEVIRETSPCTGLFNEYEMKLAKIINANMPWVEMYRSLASGTEADMVAIRIARTYTGKRKVIKVGGAYHGWSDQLVYGLHIPGTKTFEAHGIPTEVSSNTQEFGPNDTEALRKLLEANQKDGGTAAVVVEPLGPESGTYPVRKTFNEEVRKLCDEFGALLVFDEVVTGFRVGPGGAQGYFNVRPDLTVFGKIVSGGYPMAGGVGGRAEVMSCIAAGVNPGKPKAYVGGTLTANPLSSAAGYYAIKEIVEQDAARKAGVNGDNLAAGLKALVDKHGLPFVVWNTGSIVHFEMAGLMYLSASDPDITKKIMERKKAVEEFGAALTARGVITLAGSRLYTSMADNAETLAETLAAFEDACSNVEKR
jgi:glutamate-1-semialdehyde-2,1-aminomutase